MRTEGWEERLFALIKEAKTKPYVIGEHDCALFAIDIQLAITGIDMGEKIRGKYKTKKGSLRLIARLGKEDRLLPLRGATTALTGQPPISPVKSKRGDPVLWVDSEDVEHLGICVGAEVVLLTEDGLQTIPLAQCVCGWNT